MLTRHQARETILKVLFQRDFRRESCADLLMGHEVDDYVREVLRGIEDHQAEIDDLIATHTRGWRLERLHSVDRNLLRLGIYELLYRPDVPPQVVIDEAVELAKKYGSEHSGSFVNGMLDTLWRAFRQLREKTG